MNASRRLATILGADVRVWHTVDMPTGPTDVCFRGVDRKSDFEAVTSVFDPERTLGTALV
jgi:hypothetical protein